MEIIEHVGPAQDEPIGTPDPVPPGPQPAEAPTAVQADPQDDYALDRLADDGCPLFGPEPLD